MRINLKCPYEEKDEAKRLGAKWDVKAKVWYIEGVEDLTPFMKWIPRQKPGMMTLRQFLDSNYGQYKALTARSARAFGIPYPLCKGWAEKYANNVAKESSLTFGKKKRRAMNDADAQAVEHLRAIMAESA